MYQRSYWGTRPLGETPSTCLGVFCLACLRGKTVVAACTTMRWNGGALVRACLFCVCVLDVFFFFLCVSTADTFCFFLRWRSWLVTPSAVPGGDRMWIIYDCLLGWVNVDSLYQRHR